MNTEISHTSRLRVLVVDDITESRDELVKLVRQLGYDCLPADCGMQALAQVGIWQPDLLLLDLLMPDLDGFDVTRLLRQQITDRWLPVIVTSSLEGEEHFIHALSKGADDYLARPVNPSLLDAKLRHYGWVLALQSHLALLAKRQRAMFEHIADATITLDSSGKVSEANRAARHLLDKPEFADVVGQPLSLLLGMDMADLDTTRSMEITRSNGQSVPVNVSASHWASGSESFCTVTLHDLTEQRRVERMKDEFLATVSHELRTPLTSVLGALGLVAAGAAGEVPAAAQGLIVVARRNGERLSRLVDDVLDLTKLEGNQMVLQQRPASLNKLLEEAVAANTAYAERTGALLQLAIQADSPRALVDPDRLMQVMANLLSNAIKHSRSGQTVGVALYGHSDGWRIDVTDQGPGIDPAFRERLFTKFAQADGSDHRAQGGTGLGLYISRMLLDRMGARIFVESRPGEGSTFSVIIPALRESDAKPWILCIARDPQHLERLEDWLGQLATVETAMDAPSARSLVERRGPALALVADLQGQDSADAFCASLREIAKPRSITLTGSGIDEDYASRQGMSWIPAGDEARPLLIQWVGGLVSESTNRS